MGPLFSESPHPSSLGRLDTRTTSGPPGKGLGHFPPSRGRHPSFCRIEVKVVGLSKLSVGPYRVLGVRCRCRVRSTSVERTTDPVFSRDPTPVPSHFLFRELGRPPSTGVSRPFRATGRPSTRRSCPTRPRPRRRRRLR